MKQNEKKIWVKNKIKGKMIVIDGCNVAYCNDYLSKNGHVTQPEVNQLVTVVEYFQKFDFEVLVFISSALKYKIDDCNKKDKFSFREFLGKNISIQETPAEFDDDLFILETAERFGAYILSNDRFCRYKNLYYKVICRKIPFMFIKKQLIIPKGILFNIIKRRVTK